MSDLLSLPTVGLSASSSSSSLVGSTSGCPSMIFTDSPSWDSSSDTSDSIDPSPGQSEHDQGSRTAHSAPTAAPSRGLGVDEQLASAGGGSKENTPRAPSSAVFATEDLGYEADYEGRYRQKHFIHKSLGFADHRRHKRLSKGSPVLGLYPTKPPDIYILPIDTDTDTDTDASLRATPWNRQHVEDDVSTQSGTLRVPQAETAQTPPQQTSRHSLLPRVHVTSAFLQSAQSRFDHWCRANHRTRTLYPTAPPYSL
ncbi:hypothetical protein GLOTRDRAFT_130370 [Gloeophyllum trabeum ATCC 11539]|uniref:Uncharacterized protein n=1 Tax=Gloeophyllum trabeum (strain ATCC 11539 / FP-39264 / Madison 617) TaxID=670483 RepID=S7RI84_GLOTA|nr:uncharacterized protein GLOTRDRAFT_130370 [Gloeophyllum trabeum ATCC 11539]EPQ53980.1 hypothetical protein GLOTRDRAFT_130370 [Gloeophyllum trabeum ATCC 11539]